MPAALTYGLIEGLLFQSMIRGTGLAMLQLEKKALKPVFVNDSVWATVEVTAIRPASKDNRAIVTPQADAFNHLDEMMLTYRIVRMLPAGLECSCLFRCLNPES